MNINTSYEQRSAVPDDAPALAKLIDIAGEGIPHWFWSRSCTDEQHPLDIGAARARRDEGGFSYVNATVAADKCGILGMVLSYAIDKTPDDDPKTIPAPFVPFLELEAKSVGTWFINALSVFPLHRNRGIGTRLLEIAEDKGRRHGYDAITIQVFEQNIGAVRLYHQLGYKEVARSVVRCHPCQPYYTGDVILLSKEL